MVNHGYPWLNIEIFQISKIPKYPNIQNIQKFGDLDPLWYRLDIRGTIWIFGNRNRKEENRPITRSVSMSFCRTKQLLVQQSTNIQTAVPYGTIIWLFGYLASLAHLCRAKKKHGQHENIIMKNEKLTKWKAKKHLSLIHI